MCACCGRSFLIAVADSRHALCRRCEHGDHPEGDPRAKAITEKEQSR
jgi:hypothetical protein